MIPTRIVESAGLSIAVRHAGSPENPAFMLLHGWPQCASTFDPVLDLLSDEYFVLAPDLPGIGASAGMPESGEKADIAPHIEHIIDAMNAQDVILLGLDVGGMVAFACFRRFGERLAGGAILNTVIPGIAPWDDLLANPHVWHFAFHAIPELPEIVVSGNEGRYFDYFFDALTRTPNQPSKAAREIYTEAYRHPEALTTGFEWYRGMAADAEQNAAIRGPFAMPFIYIRGDQDPHDLDAYLGGFRKMGIKVTGKTIPGGHFSGDEAPEALAEVLREFRRDCDVGKPDARRAS